MRWCVATCIISLVFAGAAPVRADGQADAEKLVDAAIKAAGGTDKLKKLDAVSFKGKGKVARGSKEFEASVEISAKGTDRLRFLFDITAEGQTVSRLVVIKGNKGWLKREGKVENAQEPVLKAFKQEVRAFRYVQLLKPLKDKGVKLSPLGEVKINDRPALGLKATQDNQPDLDIYFDKETHLPVKCELRIKDPDDEELTTTWHFSDCKSVNGVKHPMKIAMRIESQTQKVKLELELSEVKPGADLDDDTFAKP
jgi:outer membrane lipoprotein-sorting protein